MVRNQASHPYKTRRICNILIESDTFTLLLSKLVYYYHHYYHYHY
jgi:hypothetical protein